MVFTDKKGVLRQDDGEFAPDPTAADPGFDLLAAGCGATRPDTPQPPGEVPLELLASLEQEARPDTAHSVQSLTEGVRHSLTPEDAAGRTEEEIDALINERTRKIMAGAVLGSTLVLATTSCSPGDSTPPSGSDPVVTATATPAPEHTAPEVEAPAPEAEAPEVTTEVGASIPADQVEAARAAGAHVFVSPRGDGSGLIVDPSGTLPDAVRADLEHVASIQVTDGESFGVQNDARFYLDQAMNDAGLSAFVVTSAIVIGDPERGGVQFDWNVAEMGASRRISPDGLNSAAPTREQALARAAQVYANYGWGRYEVIG